VARPPRAPRPTSTTTTSDGVTAFLQTTTAEAVVPVEREKIWEVLIDPAMIARFTPFVTEIVERDQHWIWTMSGLSVMGRGFSATFTEKMTLEEQVRIDFTHDPPDSRGEKAAVNGFYALRDVDGGTHLETSLEVCTDLPRPRLSGGAVRGTMRGVMAGMGDRFSTNLLDHFGVTT
jgi:carbon monoxide dehydrogenase subunit G